MEKVPGSIPGWSIFIVFSLEAVSQANLNEKYHPRKLSIS
jgi:hypothetical protein